MKMKFLLLINLLVSLCAAGVVVLEESNNDIENKNLVKNFNVKVNQILPRHQCRRALRNIEEFLYEVSKHLYEVSGGVELISKFNIELPPNWRNTECSGHINITEGQVSDIDIEVIGSHPLYRDSPHAIQFGGCGVKGQRVEIPFPIFTKNVDIKSEDLERSLVEVTKWRYGVFEEQGIEGDLMYPPNITEGVKVVGNSGCSQAQLKLGGGLCPLIPYNNGAHTKQNLLCGRVSARRSILNQFSTKQGAKFVKPEIKFVMPLDTKRVILILDQSPTMADKWKSVLAATFQFINSLREGTELSIISFAETATIHLEPTRVEGGNREGLHYRIPRRLPAEDETATMKSCLDCGIELAMKLATNTTSIVLLSSSVYFDSKNNSKLMEFEQSANPILHRLVFGTKPRTHQHIHNNVFLINEHQNTLNITSQLSLALASLTNDYPSQKFHHELLPMNNLEGSFSVESSLSSDLWLQLLVEDTTEINVFEIKSPSGQVFAFPKFDAGLVYFSLRGPRETGVWSYRIKLYSRPTPSKNLILECWASGSLNQVQISSWTSVSDKPNQPVFIYAKLEQESVPVANADVFAVIQKPGSSSPTRIKLVDSGSGYPDITQGDAIYSGYFTQFSGEPGLYSVTIEAINNSTASIVNTKKLENSTIDCAGSSYPLEPSIPLESFNRFSATPSFYVSSGSEFYISSGSVQKRDVFPPNRVTDFKLANYFNNSLFVTLSWTAPGDDFTMGKAFRYEIRCFTAQEALSEENFGEQGILVHSSLVPSPEAQGVEQRCTVGVPWPNEVFYYAVVAFDAAGNRGEVSNSIAIYVNEPVTTTSEASTIKFSNMKDVSQTLPLKSFIHSESLMYIIAGIISLILIIIVIILTVIIRRLGGCRRKNDSSSISVPDSSTPSLPDLCHDQSYMRNSVSYISGYDLPEMLEYALRSPQKASAQEIANIHRLHSTEQSQYLGMNTSSIYQSPSIRSPTHIEYKVKKASDQLKNYETHPRLYPEDSSESPPPSYHQAHSPSISPVNSNYTAGQSTDCSVSVSGSDHELVSDSLQVVMIPPLKSETSESRESILNEDSRDLNHPSNLQRPEPKPRKIPPAVPNKTVHASLV